jgi:hypothetical protein
MRRNPCGKVNISSKLLYKQTKPPPKGGFLHILPSTNTKKTNKQKPQQEILLGLYHAELFTEYF